MHPHPLHGDSRAAVPVEVDQRVDPCEEEPRSASGAQSVTYGVQWLIHMHSWRDHQHSAVNVIARDNQEWSVDC